MNGDRAGGPPPADDASGHPQGHSQGHPRLAKTLSVRRRRRFRRRPRFSGPSFNRIIPNLLTLLGLCAGLTSMRLALEGRFGSAAVAISVAACIDGLDGRLARLLRATTRFGAEFDSLSDFLCFGVAPSFVIYLWSLRTVHGFGFVPCLMFSVCMALRLARFNAALDAPKDSATIKPAYVQNFFTGVPAPMGAALALFPLFIGLEAREMEWPGLLALSHAPLFCAAVLAGTALLLVSTLPVWSFKNFKVPANYVLPLLLGLTLYVALLVADPWAALAALGVIYMGMLPFSARSFRRLQHEALRDDQEAPEMTGQGTGLSDSGK